MEPLVFGLILSGFCVALLMDISTHKLPNWLALSALFGGLVVHTYSSGFSGLGHAALGSVAGLLLLPLYLKRFIGAGDVKLMIGLGALMGPIMTCWVIALGVLLGAVISPLIGAGKVGWQGVKATLKRYYLSLRTGTYLPPVPGEVASLRVPYAPSLAAGWLLTLNIQLPGL